MASCRQKQTALKTTQNTIANKLTAMAPAGDRSSKDDGITMTQLVEELSKQQASLKEDISTLVTGISWAVADFSECPKMDSFQQHLTTTESLAGDNFDKIFASEAAIKTLQTQNAPLLDRIEDLENQSRRANLRIVNVPEDSEGVEDSVKFVSNMSMEITGNVLFESALLWRECTVGKKLDYPRVRLWYVSTDSKKKNECCNGLDSTQLHTRTLP